MAKAYYCKYFSSVGNVYGGCKHPKATSACLHYDIDKCNKSERRYKTKYKQQNVISARQEAEHNV